MGTEETKNGYMERVFEANGSPNKWDTLYHVAEDCMEELYTLGHDDAVYAASHIIMHMAKEIDRLDKKVDELIDENKDLQQSYDVLKNGLDAVVAINDDLGKENKLLTSKLEARLDDLTSRMSQESEE